MLLHLLTSKIKSKTMTTSKIATSKINSKTNWSIILLAYVTLFSLGLLDSARGPYFADIMSDLHLTNTQGSLFFAVVSSMAFFTAWIVPSLVRNFSLLMVIRMGLLVMGLGFALVSMASNFMMLLLSCVIFGFGFGVLNVAQNLLILEGASSALRRRLFSGLHGMYAFASLVAPLVAAQLFRMQITWRTAFMGFASVVVVSLVVSLFVKQDKSFQKNKSISEISGSEKNLEKIKFKSYGLVGSMLSLYVLAELLVSTRLSLYVRQVYFYSPEQAANLLALFFLFLLLGRVIFFLISFKASSLLIIEFCIVFTFFAYVLGLWVHPWLFALTGLTMAPIFALSLDMVADMFPDLSSLALSNVIGLSCVYIVSMHVVMGLLSDWIGIAQAMTLGLVFLFVTWVLLKAMKCQTIR